MPSLLIQSKKPVSISVIFAKSIPFIPYIAAIRPSGSNMAVNMVSNLIVSIIWSETLATYSSLIELIVLSYDSTKSINCDMSSYTISMYFTSSLSFSVCRRKFIMFRTCQKCLRYIIACRGNISILSNIAGNGRTKDLLWYSFTDNSKPVSSCSYLVTISAKIL
jgi:hypothetical protein